MVLKLGAGHLHPSYAIIDNKIYKKVHDFKTNALLILKECHSLSEIEKNNIEEAEEENLKQKAKQLGVDNNIIWLGAIYEQESLAPWFLYSKALIHPGAIGLSLLHSMGYGLPVLTHSNLDMHMPEIAAFKEGMNGLFFDGLYTPRGANNHFIFSLVPKLMPTSNLWEETELSILNPSFSTKGKVCLFILNAGARKEISFWLLVLSINFLDFFKCSSWVLGLIQSKPHSTSWL